MKSAVNGGLQLSVLDGWWAEAHRDGNGWALSGEVDTDIEAQDARDGAELGRLLREEAFLAANLAGYGDYRGRVRYRLAPLFW